MAESDASKLRTAILPALALIIRGCYQRNGSNFIELSGRMVG
jgi:hypothetical protein